MRSSSERIEDILAAIARCQAYREYLSDPVLTGMALDAILRNLAVIGEAVRVLPDEFRSEYPGVQWTAIAGLRNIVVHEYFRIEHDLITDIVDNHLRPLGAILSD